MLKSVLVIFLVNYLNSVKCLEVPDAKLEAIYPKGLRVSIPGYVNEAGEPVNIEGSSLGNTAPSQASPGYPCELSISTVSVPGFVCKGQLLFEDNFNSPLPKGKIWTAEIMFPVGPDYPFNVYTNDQSVRVGNGKLIIEPVPLVQVYGEDIVWKTLDLTNQCTGILGTSQCKREPSGALILPPIMTAKVTTKNSFSFKYGRVEVRAKMPRGDWLIPLIQLEPRDKSYGFNDYVSGLLRIACVKGNLEYLKTLQGGPIMSESEPYRSANLVKLSGDEPWSNEFHDYTLEWTPEAITVSVDGKEYGRVSPPQGGFFEEARLNSVQAAARWAKGTRMAPFDEMFYISVGMDVGGIHEFPDDALNKPWKNSATKAMVNFWNARSQWNPTWMESSRTLQVEYVKVYAL